MEHAFSHGSTFAPNELAMAAGLATLHELDEGGLVARARRSSGERLLELTRPLVERYDVVREVRGLGLMWAIEFGEPALARTLLPAASTGSSRASSRSSSSARSSASTASSARSPATASPVVKALPALTVDEDDLAWFADGLEQTIAQGRARPARRRRLRADRRADPLTEP